MSNSYLSLTGSWSYSNSQKSIHGEGIVPGCVHLDLLRENKLRDPHYGDQELEQFWVGQTTWHYTKAFSFDEEQCACPLIELVFEGLDTLATVKLNGCVLGEANNQHRTWVFDITKAVRPGENLLMVTFHSVYPEIERFKSRRELNGNGQYGFCVDGGQYIRKSACNFGWDWGPKCVTAGIWREVGIRFVRTARIEELEVRQLHQKKGVTLTLTAQVAGNIPAGSIMEFHIETPSGKTLFATASVKRKTARATVVIAQAELWWPSGYGGQPLYRTRAVLKTTRNGETLDSKDKRIGLRKVELVQQKDQWGEAFGFRINDREVFARGANWIPADTFVTRVDDQKLALLLGAAKEANMNMVRVWGGGIYESDAFYNLCDELGLMVWQDFLFACHSYPAYDGSWMENVREEAEQNLLRIRHHASVVLWCGNNELRQMPSAVSDGKDGKAMSWQEYDQLFGKLLKRLAARLAPETPYIDGSPCERMSAKFSPHSDEAGDLHYWGVWWGMQSFESYRSIRPRFCSEFGFQSYPHPATIAEFAPASEHHLSSYILDFHQRGSTSGGDGNSTILSYVASWFRLPPNFHDSVVVTQLCQAMAIKYAAEFWRFNQPRCQGVVYWQLNDCWPGQSWSSIDGACRWKALQYFAKDFFAPLLIGGIEDRARQTVEVHVCNNGITKFSGEWECELGTTSGEPLKLLQGKCTLQPGRSKKVAVLNASTLQGSVSPRDLLVWMRLRDQGVLVSQNLAFLVRPKHLRLQDPGLKIRSTRSFTEVTATTAPALWVVKNDADGFAPGRNFVCLPKGGSARFQGPAGADGIFSLYDLGMNL